MGSCPDLLNMVGRLCKLSLPKEGPLLGLLLLSLICLSNVQAQDGCLQFNADYCNMRLDNILMLDSNITSAAECQALCFRRDACVKFSHFSSTDSRCVLFRECSEPIRSCSGCVSGPPFPRISSCQRLPLRNDEDVPRSSQANSDNFPDREVTKELEPEVPMDPYGEDGSFDDYESGNDDAIDDGFQDEVMDEGFDDEEEEEDDDVSIDDGLLDEVFSELPGTDNAKNNNNNKRNKSRNKNSCPTCPTFNTGFYYCLMGGSNAYGPVSAVSVLNTGTYAIPRTPLIAAFPPSMTQGSGATFSTFSGRSLMTCTPGYAVTGLTPASTFGPFLTQAYIPGTCNAYDFKSRNWGSTGGKLTTVRQGGSTLRIGSYLLALGGTSPSGYPIRSIEIFDTRRANIGWKVVPRWNFPSATKDMCTIMTRDAQRRPEMIVIGGEGQEGAVMKMVLSTGQWFSLPNMLYPRRQHACTKVNMNNRPGIVVSGGTDGFQRNMTAVEFFDLNSGTWVSLPSLDRGRRSHIMTTVEGSLAVAGGAATGFRGDQEYLDDVEVFDGRRWKRANYRMDGPRNGANLVKIPFDTFRG